MLSRLFLLPVIAAVALLTPANSTIVRAQPASDARVAAPSEMPGGPLGIIVWPCGSRQSGWCCVGRSAACAEFIKAVSGV